MESQTDGLVEDTLRRLDRDRVLSLAFATGVPERLVLGLACIEFLTDALVEDTVPESLIPELDGACIESHTDASVEDTLRRLDGEEVLPLTFAMGVPERLIPELVCESGRGYPLPLTRWYANTGLGAGI